MKTKTKPNNGFILCRDCKEEFNPNEPHHSEIGYYNQCRNCAEAAGGDDIKVKAFTSFDPKSGDWQGIKIVSNKKFKEFKRLETIYGNKYGDDEFISAERITED